jgi:hypothetical protein
MLVLGSGYDPAISDSWGLGAYQDAVTSDVLLAEDNFIDEIAPTNNYGGSLVLWAHGRSGGQTGKFSQSLLRFDMQSIPANAVISSASLVITVDNAAATGSYYQVRELTEDFVHNEANWTLRQAGINWQTAGGTFAGTNLHEANGIPTGVRTLELSPVSTLQTWVNQRATTRYRSLILKPKDTLATDNVRFHSKNASVSTNWPRLSVTYTQDISGPAVSISAPANNATVSGATVAVSATASDAVGVAGVQFKLDGANLGAEDTSSPYSSNWNSTTATNGAHTLTAVARDWAGNLTTSSSIAVTVSNVAAPAEVPVVWVPSSMLPAGKLTADGGTLTNSNGNPAGAISEQTLAPGALGYVTTTIASAVTNERSFGLGASNDSQLRADINYAISLWGPYALAFHSGTYLTEISYAVGDTFKVAVEAGTPSNKVVFSKNGVAFHTLTSPGLPATAMTVDSSFTGDGSVLDNVKVNFGGGAPASTYTSPSHQDSVPRLPLPALDPAPYAFTDPAFGSNMLRVTDPNTFPGSPGKSFQMPSNAHTTAFSKLGTKFFVTAYGGAVIPYTFNRAIPMEVSRMSGPGDGGLTLSFNGEPTFSLVDDNLLYGYGRANARTVIQYNFGIGNYGDYEDILNMDMVFPGIDAPDNLRTYLGGMSAGADPSGSEKIMVFGGGTRQDKHMYIAWFDKANPGNRRVVQTKTDTNTSTVSTNGGTPVDTNILLNFTIHGAQMDKSGRYVMIYPQICDLQSPSQNSCSTNRMAAQAFLWDTTENTFSELHQNSYYIAGHDASGYGVHVNQDVYQTVWDPVQWQLRSYATPANHRDVLVNTLSPAINSSQYVQSEHSSWTNSTAAKPLVPFLSTLFRYGIYTGDHADPTTWRPYSDEIVGVQTDMAAGANAKIWRFAHHRADPRCDNTPPSPEVTYFWYQPIAMISQDGKWALFHSNWEKSLGPTSPSDTDNQSWQPCHGTKRRDVFLIELK